MKRFAIATVCSVISLAFLSQASMAEPENRAATVLTAEMAEKVLGTPVEPEKVNSEKDAVSGQAWVSRVYYQSKTAEVFAPTVGVLIRHADSKERAKEVFEKSKTLFKGVDVEGLGEPAYRTETPAQLNVLKGQNWLIFSAGTFKKADPEREEQLAKEVLPKVTF